MPLAWQPNEAAIAAELEGERTGRALEVAEDHPLRRLLRAAAESIAGLRGTL